jgi:hypothetical protein
MLLVYTGCCKPKKSPAPPKDYSSYLESIIKLSERILVEVSDHQTTTSIDLSPVIAELQRIKADMQNVTVSIEQNTQILLNQFIAITNNIDGFKSSILVAMNSFSSLFKLESDESQALLAELVRKVSDLDLTVEIELFEFDFTIVAGTQGGNYIVPYGTTELVIIAKTCDSFLVNELEYADGMHLGRDWRSIGRKAVVNGRKDVMLLPESEHHITYTALRNIGDITVSGDLILRKGRREQPKVSVTDDIASLADLAQSIVEASTT